MDEVIDVCVDLMASAPQDSDAAVKKEKREAWAAPGGKLPRFLTFLNDKYAAGAPFLLGGGISIADLAVYAVVDGIQSGSYDYVPASAVDSYAAVVAAAKAVAANEHVIAVKSALAAEKEAAAK